MGPIIFDGAFGTYYHKISTHNEPCERGNINDQETVYRIHREYVDAGVDAIKTNTFGANRMNFPDESTRNTILRNGFDLATAAVKGTSALVFADIGYFDPDSNSRTNEDSDQKQNGNPPQETDKDSSAETVEGFKEISIKVEYRSIAEQFVKNGATRFIFETLAEYEPILLAVEWIKKTNPDAVILVTFAVSQDGYTRKGLYYKALLKQSIENPDIDGCGLNCVCGPNHILQLLREIDPKGKSLCAMPNAGYPATVNGRTVFQDNAGYFAGKLNDLRLAGVDYLGGCCGTTPEHMRQAILLIRNPARETAHERVFPSLDNQSHEFKTARVNLFRERLHAGKTILAVELEPPLDADASFLLIAAKKAKNAGAHIITIADSPLARTRADSILLAAKVKREIGIDTLPHLSCRDRNYIGLKASLLGASIENINNILAVTGDPIPQTDRGEMKGVFSYNSFQLISFIKSLNEEVLQQSPFLIAAALNVNSNRFESELKRAQKKIDKGADLFLTQPLFSAESIQHALDAKNILPVRILFGIMPVASYKNALFLNNEVAGIHIPEEFVEKLYGKTPEEVEALSLEFCMDIVQKTRAVADGYYLMMPLKKIDLVCKLIERITALEK